jgi:hypothetical protein
MEVRMKAAQMITVLMAVSGLVMHVAQAQQPGTKRTDNAQIAP